MSHRDPWRGARPWGCSVLRPTQTCARGDLGSVAGPPPGRLGPHDGYAAASGPGNGPGAVYSINLGNNAFYPFPH